MATTTRGQLAKRTVKPKPKKAAAKKTAAKPAAKKTAKPTVSKTQLMIDACTGKGATVEELMNKTGQSLPVMRSRIHAMTKAGKLKAVPESKPRRYLKV